MFQGKVAKSSGAKLVFFNTVSTYIACGCAGFSNAYFMRQTEIKKGINVINPETKKPVGLSKKCASVAVFDTASSRFVMASTIFIPAVSMLALEKLKVVPTGKLAKGLLDFGLIFLVCYSSVPLSVAMFPKEAIIKSSELEVEFQHIKGKNGTIKEFLYNKGM